MEAVHHSELMANFYQTTFHIPEDVPLFGQGGTTITWYAANAHNQKSQLLIEVNF
jgi:hypothetical protein